MDQLRKKELGDDEACDMDEENHTQSFFTNIILLFYFGYFL